MINQLMEQTADGDLSPEVRRLRVMIHNFCRLEDGSLLDEIDLRRYAIDSGSAITNTTVQELCAVHQAIKTLNLTNCAQVSDVGLWAIARHCPRIQRLLCSGCLQLTNVGIRSLSLRCSALVELDVSHCAHLDDMTLTVLAGGTWKLQRLIMENCVKLSDNGLMRLVQGVGHSLVSLNLNGCPNIGEFGDRGLKEIGAQCKILKELLLGNVKRVEDGGLIALANGCPQLERLVLSGCDTISKKSWRVCCQSWVSMKDLTLIDNRKMADQDLQFLQNSPLQNSLRVLQLRNFQSLTDKGIAFICQSVGESISQLSFTQCTQLTDYAAMIIANFCKQIRHISLVDCGRFTDESIHSFARRLRYLTELHLDGNRHITTRALLQHIGREFEFVEMATQWLGYQPKARVETLIAKREEQLVHNQQAVKIQCMVRKRFADRIYWVRYREKLISRTIPLFQAIVRGHLQRKRFRYLKFQVHKVRQAIKIQCVFRRHLAYQRYLKMVRAKRFREHCEKVAIVWQRLYRGHKARVAVQHERAEQANKRFAKAKKRALEEVRAISVQRVFRGHIARCEAMRRIEKNEREMSRRALVDEKIRFLQRVMRGKIGRIRARQRRAEIALFKLRWYKAREIQRVYRGHLGRVRFNFFLEQHRQNIRKAAALRIQYNYRGYRGRLLAAVARALRLLRIRQQSAAVDLQRFLRGCMGRHQFKVHKELVTRRRRQDIAAVEIQRVFRGHKGREARELEQELQKLEDSARPLIAHLHEKEDKAQELREIVHKLEYHEKRMHEELFEIERELEHCMKTTNKYTDSIRINQTPQRFLTKFLQVRLKDHLDHETELLRLKFIELQSRRAELRDVEIDVLNTKRELVPLTTGLIGEVKRARAKRLRELVWRRRESAIKIQAVWRRALVRFSLYDPYKEGWVERINRDISDKPYYFNTISKETVAEKPLAYHFFGERTVSEMDALHHVAW